MSELGEVTLESTGRTGTREIRIIGTAPGYGLATSATFDYRELFQAVDRVTWELIRYTYEYRTADGGRRGYHLHDVGFHAHCVDPREPRGDHHYRAPEIDLFEAHDEFRLLYVTGTPVSCRDLRPVIDQLREPEDQRQRRGRAEDGVQ